MDLLGIWSNFLWKVRGFFRERNYLEVSTPHLLPFPNLDPNVEPVSLHVKFPSGSRIMWLHTSPEYAMKKILSRYGKSIFQICRVFRNNEHGRLHRVEFLMLEWYRVGGTYRDLMEELKELIGEVTGIRNFREVRIGELFREITGRELPHKREDLLEIMKEKGIYHREDEDWETLFYRVFIEMETVLRDEGAVFLTHFPRQMCALAKVSGGYAERFELLINGIEIANGWTEETDPEEVRRRLEIEARRRGLPLDEEFIAAHKSIPSCAGCSVGLDRLLMVSLGKESLEDIELLGHEPL